MIVNRRTIISRSSGSLVTSIHVLLIAAALVLVSECYVVWREQKLLLKEVQSKGALEQKVRVSLSEFEESVSGNSLSLAHWRMSLMS
jgi:hypothetical protein